MRTIKFRGKNKHRGWVYDDLIKTWNDKFWIIGGSRSRGGWLSIYARFEVDKDTLCQFTGLYDKNGKEIYENDIVTDSSDRLMKIVWHNYGFRLEAIKETNFKYGTLINWFIKETNRCDLEVIGNIHDNKELLNENN